MSKKVRKYIEYFKFVRKTSRLTEYRGLASQLVEIMVVFIMRGIGPGYYLMAEMGKKQYGWDYKLGFFNGRQYVRRINKINNPRYYPATFNKLIEKSLLAQYAISTPKLFGYLSLARGRSCEGANLKTAEDFYAFIEKINVTRFCFKLISGQGGVGFKAVEVVRNKDSIALQDIESQQLYAVDAYYAELGVLNGGEFLIEEYFEQHPGLKIFNPSSVNTLRVMVYQQSSGKKPRCMGVYLRIGRKGSIIDNGSAGGISAKVNVHDGTLHAATFAYTRAYSFQRHPDSAVLLEGAEIPLLSEAISLAVDAIEVFPGIKYGVFDVAIGVSEPTIIELNCMADYVDFSILNLPSRLVLS